MKPPVAHIITDLDTGGAERSLALLLPRLQTWYNNHVIALTGRGPIGDVLAKRGLPIHYLEGSGISDVRLAPRLSQALHALRPNAAVTYLWHADLLGRFVARRLHIPVISAQRSSLYRRQWARIPERASASLVEHYIVQTEAARLWVRGRNVSVIPNAVEVPEHRHATSSDVHTILAVSNLRPEKGLDTLLYAAQALLQRRTPTWRLQIVGEGADRSRLEALISSLGLTAHVSLLGHQSDVSSLLSSASLFVHPSPAEGMSNAILEAMAHGLPVVASDIPANRAVIRSHHSGLLVPTGDAGAYATAFATLLADEPLRARLGQTAAEHVRTHHSPNLIAQQWRNVIDQVTHQ